MKKLLLSLLFFLWSVTCPLLTVSAITDPLSVPNNKFGIHIIQAAVDEIQPASELVNNNGDWGYITVLIEGKDKNKDKWQTFFNDLRRRHLIPIVRLSAIPEGNVWKRPDIGEAQVWADFLDSLNWPTKNRYVIIYNEPNHATEWGGSVDAKGYSQILDKTIAALKSKSADFFVLNAGIDASAPQQLPNYEDEVSFLRKMNEEVPGIFEKLDGWVSHSYPNPGFVGSPNANGRGTVRTYQWEEEILKDLQVNKRLPIFITETGWKHAEGLNYSSSLPTEDILSSYYQNAFQNAWNSPNIVAITPFLLSYQEVPFDHFSFKNTSNSYYSFYQTIKDLPKKIGKPIQENKAKLIKGEVYSSIVAGQTYDISITFKNVGQSIWGDTNIVKLIPLQGGKELGIKEVEIPTGVKVEPEGEHTFKISLKAPDGGKFDVSLNLFLDSKQFESAPVKFSTEVKLPVILKVLGKLKWKNDPQGDYILRVSGVVGDSAQNIKLNNSGTSGPIEAKYLLPDYTFEFSLEKPYYHPLTIRQTLKSGVNTLDFGVLQPALLPALLHPKEFWQLLPFSN